MVDPFRGGAWTDRKVRALYRYMLEYMRLMRDKPNPLRPFKKLYFDAFCGSGGRLSADFPLLGGDEISAVAATSPRAALKVSPRFDEYYFYDVRRQFVDKLRQALAGEGHDLSNCRFGVGDANAEISGFCSRINWASSRCVMFLDPLGLQVEWATLETVARTRAIDLWYLFPARLGPLRMTPKSGEVPDAWAERLTRIWGDASWMQVAYSVGSDQLSLLDEEEPRLIKTGKAVEFELAFIERMKGIFGGVTDTGLRLVNSRGSHMFSLIFACANDRPAAVGPALRIANHIVTMKDI